MLRDSSPAFPMTSDRLTQSTATLPSCCLRNCGRAFAAVALVRMMSGFNPTSSRARLSTLCMYTLNSAWPVRYDDKPGSIEAGKLAKPRGLRRGSDAGAYR